MLIQENGSVVNMAIRHMYSNVAVMGGLTDCNPRSLNDKLIEDLEQEIKN